MAHAADGRLVAGPEPQAVDDVPIRAVVDSRAVGPGDLFFGLPGENVDGGRFAAKAIALAIGSAAPGDVVVIAGKGHEQGQEFENGRKEPFDDVTVAREALRAVLARA